jgi:hypothetical protein
MTLVDYKLLFIETVKWKNFPGEINGDNLNNVRCEDIRHFRNKKRQYLKDKNNVLATNNKNKKISER